MLPAAHHQVIERRQFAIAFNDGNIIRMGQLLKANPDLANMRIRKSGDKTAPLQPIIYHALCKIRADMVELLKPHCTDLKPHEKECLKDRAGQLHREKKIGESVTHLINYICENTEIKAPRDTSGTSSRSISPATVFAPAGAPGYGSVETSKEKKEDRKCCRIC